MEQMSILFTTVEVKEDIQTVLKALKAAPCASCRLSIIHPDNPGIVARGNPLAEIAVIAEAPGDKETEAGLPLVGPSGEMFEKWLRVLGLDSRKDMFIMNVLHCQPPKVKRKDSIKPVQRQPHPTEITACFPNRTLRILKAMPNLKCIIAMGMVAAETLLGGEPKLKTHDGHWFGTRLVPGVAVFCMSHPAYLLRDPSPENKGKVIKVLRDFRREWIDSDHIRQLIAADYQEHEL